MNMNTLKLKLVRFLLFVLALSLFNCTTNDYDLKQGINTNMTLGGDSLSFPIGKTKKILLGSLLDDVSLDILKKSQNGAYLLQYKDSISPIKINTLNPVNFSIAPISITPITANLADIKVPTFTVNPINLISNLPIPSIDYSGLTIPAITESFTKQIDISQPLNTKRMVKTNQGSSSVLYDSGLIKYHDAKTITQSLLFNFPTQLKKINSIILKNNTFVLRIDKTELNNLGFDNQNDTLKNFAINFPSEFVLSSPVGSGASIIGNSFVISNAVLTSTNVYTASFKIDRLNLSSFDQSLSILNYTKPIPYSVDYSFRGTTSNPALLQQKANMNISLSSAPSIDDMNIETNDFLVTVPGGSNTINQTIQLPAEVSKVNSLTFSPGATLQISIQDPSISPFSFKAGACIISLPKKFVFNPYNGLDLTTNTLTIPYNQLFGTKTIGIAGMTINQTVPNGSSSITVTDNLSYNINGLTVGNQTTSTSIINGMTNKKINVTGTVSGLTISNASLITKNISISIPNQSTNIDVNQFVSTDVKTINTITLKNPSTLEFKIAVSNLPAAIDSVFFSNYVIQLPTFLQFKSGDVNSQNQLVLNSGFKVSTGFSKILTIQKFDFGATGINLTNGNFNLHDVVTMSGNAYVKGKNVNSSDISNVVISPTVTIGSMSIGQLEGKFTPTISTITQNIPIDLQKYLASGSVLDIVNPVLTLEIGNTFGIPVNLNMTLTPKKNGVAQSAGILNTNISVAPASVLGQTTWSKFWISNLCKGYSAGFDTINVALPKLLKSVPDQIEISAIPTVTGTKQSIDLSSTNNQINLKYSVNVPLSFGIDFTIQYKDTIGDLKKQLADILKYARQVDVIAIIENSIPAELSFDAKPLNSANAIISGVNVTTLGKIKSGNVDGTAQTSKVTFSLRETATGALDLLDALALNISAKTNITIAGIPLNANQYITVELRIVIPKGITINPSTKK